MVNIEAKEQLTAVQVFKLYIKPQLLGWWIFLLILLIVSLFNSHRHLDWDVLWIVLVMVTSAAFFLGYLDYHFYEKEAPKICLRLIGVTPLKKFQDLGFIHEFDGQHKLIGDINGFQVVISPTVNRDRRRFLIILIPITLKDGLEEYLSKFDELFRLTLNGEVLMASATIKDYDKTYDFDMLFNSIKRTTNLLLERNIKPLEITGD